MMRRNQPNIAFRILKLMLKKRRSLTLVLISRVRLVDVAEIEIREVDEAMDRMIAAITIVSSILIIITVVDEAEAVEENVLQFRLNVYYVMNNTVYLNVINGLMLLPISAFFLGFVRRTAYALIASIQDTTGQTVGRKKNSDVLADPHSISISA